MYNVNSIGDNTPIVCKHNYRNDRNNYIEAIAKLADDTRVVYERPKMRIFYW